MLLQPPSLRDRISDEAAVIGLNSNMLCSAQQDVLIPDEFDEIANDRHDLIVNILMYKHLHKILLSVNSNSIRLIFQKLKIFAE